MLKLIFKKATKYAFFKAENIGIEKCF